MNLLLLFYLWETFEWVSEWELLSRVQLFVTPWAVACQAPLSKGFSRQEYWSRLSFPSPGNLSKPGIEPESPTLQADALPSEPPEKPWLLSICTYILVECLRHIGSTENKSIWTHTLISSCIFVPLCWTIYLRWENTKRKYYMRQIGSALN